MRIWDSLKSIGRMAARLIAGAVISGLQRMPAGLKPAASDVFVSTKTANTFMISLALGILAKNGIEAKLFAMAMEGEPQSSLIDFITRHYRMMQAGEVVMLYTGYECDTPHDLCLEFGASKGTSIICLSGDKVILVEKYKFETLTGTITFTGVHFQKDDFRTALAAAAFILGAEL